MLNKKMLKSNFDKLKNFISSSTYSIAVVAIVFVYFLLYSLLVNFNLSEHYTNIFYALDDYFIFWILFFDFAVRMVDAIYKNQIFKEISKPGNLVDVAIFISMFSFSEHSYHLIWLRLIRLLYLIHFNEKIHITLLKFKESKIFNYTNTLIILAYAVLIGIQTTYHLDKSISTYLNILDVLIMMYFVVEITVKIFARHNVTDFFYKNDKFNWWNIFDFLIVFVSILPLHELANVLVVRVLRLLRIFTAISALKKILKALQYSISSIGYILMLLAVIFFIYANIGVHFFGHFTYEEGQPNLWKDLPSALLTLYRVLTFEDWTDVMYQTQTEYPIFGSLYFVSFTALTVFIFLNLFTGVIIEQIQKANSNLLKFKLNDEQNDLEEGGVVYDHDNYIVIFNYSNKLIYILKELDRKAYTDNTHEYVIIILNDADKVDCFEEGDCFIGRFSNLKVRFVYADLLKEETHHRFDIYNAKSVIMLNYDFNLDDVSDENQTIKADNLNIKIFSFLMNNKAFVLNMIYHFLSYKRMNCLVELHTTHSADLVRSIMKETINDFIDLSKIQDDKEVYYKLSNDAMLLDKFKTSKKRFIKRLEDNKGYNYESSFSERDFFAIINQSKSTGQILSNAIQYFMIYKTMLALFSFNESYIQYIEYKPSLFKNRKNNKLLFIEACMLYDNGLLLGYSTKHEGFIIPVINPGPNAEIPEDCYLIVHSKDKKIKGRNEYKQHTFDNFSCENINKDKNILIIDDRTRPIEINNQPEVIDIDKSPDKLSQYYQNKERIKALFDDYDFIIINLEDDKAYNLIILFLETIKENRKVLKDKLITVFDNSVYAKLLKDSFYRFENSIESKHLQSLFIAQISQNSHTQGIINQLLFSEDSNNHFYRIKFDNKDIENFDQLKGGLLEHGYLYLASVHGKTHVTLNDDNYKTITEAIVISNESLIQCSTPFPNS